MEDTQKLKKIVKYGTLVFVGLIIARLLNYGTRVYLARTLSPEGYGLIYLALAIFTLLSVFDIVGLNRAIQRYGAIYKGQGDDSRLKGVIVSSFKISLPISIVLAVLLFVLSDWISVTYFTPELAPLLKIFSFMFPVAIFLRISSFTSIGLQKVKYQVYSERLIKPFMNFFAVVLLLYMGFGVIAGALGFLIGTIVAATAGFYFLESKVFPIIRSKVKAVPMKKELLAFSIPIFLATLMDDIINTVSSIMLGSFMSVSDVGIFQAALPTSQLITIVPISLTVLFVPMISEFYVQGKKQEIKNMYKILSKWIFFATLPIMVFFALFSRTFLGTFFGPEYIGASSALTILAIGFMAISFSELSLGILDTMKKTKFYLFNSVVGAIFNVILNFFLIQSHGIMGAAIATTATFVLISLLRILESYYYVRIFPFSMNFLKPVVAASISAGIIFYITQFLFVGPSSYIMFVFGFLFFVLYAGLVLILRSLEPTDVIILKEIENKSGIRISFLRKIIKKFI